tara:strand:- start:176 stop:841 length:666 start_codon:yes stop_codon:yes gene_type:complete
MNKRKLIKLTGVCLMTIAFSAFKLPSIGGGGGDGADWKSIAGDFNSGFSSIAAGLVKVVDGIKASKEAIGIKETAAVQELEELNKASGGGKVGSATIKKATEYVQDSTTELAKALEGKQLSAEEKAKLVEASKNYFQGAVKAVPGYVKVIVTFKKAGDAGTPGPTDLLGAAKDIPNIMANAPAMLEMIPTTYEAIKTYRKSLEKADIPVQVSESDLAINMN